MKTINQKIADSDLKKLNYYRDKAGLTQAAFILAAIKEKCERERHLRAGGMVLTIPSPDNNIVIDTEQKAAFLETLKEADLKLNKIIPGMLDLSELAAFYFDHFFRMTDKQRQAFQNNFYKDLKFEDNLTEDE
jgi:hypothetical protein